MHRVHRCSPHIVSALNPKAPTSPTPQLTSANPRSSWRKQVQQLPPLPPSIDQNRDPTEPKCSNPANPHIDTKNGQYPQTKKAPKNLRGFLASEDRPYLLRRRRARPRIPSPRTAIEAGSGTIATPRMRSVDPAVISNEAADPAPVSTILTNLFALASAVAA